MHDTADEAGTRAIRADGGVAETDVELRDLRLDPEELAEGVTKVRVSGGTLRARVEAAGIPSALGLEEDASTRLDLGRIASDRRTGLFVVVREHDGRWFVSPELTALQYLVELEELPGPDWSVLDEPADGESQSGPRTGEQLLARLADAINTRNVSGAIDLAARDEAGPLRAYRASLEALAGRIDEEVAVSVQSSDIVERSEGDRLVRLDVANLQASGSVETYDDYDSAQLTLNGLCVAVDGDQRTCNAGMQRVFGVTRFFAMAERDGERLRLSPTATVLGYGRLMIERLGPDGLARVLGMLPPDGGRELEAGSTVTGELSDAGVAVHPYRADGEQFLAIDTDRKVMLFDPGDTRLESVGCVDRVSVFHLPERGAYRVVVGTLAYEPASYRVVAQPVEVRALAVPGRVSGTIPRVGRVAAFRVRSTGEAIAFDASSDVRSTFGGPLHEPGGCYQTPNLMGPAAFLYDAGADAAYDDYWRYDSPDSWLYDSYDVGEYLLLVGGAPGTRFKGEVTFE